MNNAYRLETTQTLSEQPRMAGTLDAPQITFLGSLDDERGTDGFGLGNEAPKPFLAIIYNPI
ncbi:hypothetical protein EZI54_06115 [Marinobacter halodurans]|uniref:Uncharacterized protein n=1 Tax=Marinobacter halodurans TaxID=2528979 RepID=A0ABY1ZMQ5_9GAMM|nr:hypothetical protein [Marinobacter halodurans]TBW57614.1 hypothetical protein EZI54_06115 [Marinobacter halodurans]